MSLAAAIEQARDYAKGASDDFRAQIDRVREGRKMTGQTQHRSDDTDRGIDRSRTLAPIRRPQIVRTLT